MFDIGFWEILLIAVLALIIIGPERLPDAARKAGYWIGRGRRFIEGVRSDVENEVDLNEFKRLLHNQEVQINELQQQLKSGVTEVEAVKTDLQGSVMTDVPSHRFDDDAPYTIMEQDYDVERDAPHATQKSHGDQTLADQPLAEQDERGSTSQDDGRDTDRTDTSRS